NGKLGRLDAYITGDDPDVAVLIVHDLLGWETPNLRLLADHYAREVGATVYIPNIFDDGKLKKGKPDLNVFDQTEYGGCRGKISRERRHSEIAECARILREDKRYKKVGAVGYGFGGPAVSILSAKGVVDCASITGPLGGLYVERRKVPVQILVAQHDEIEPAESILIIFKDLVNSMHLDIDFNYFAGVEQDCFVHGDTGSKVEHEAMEKARIAVVG
ncbi:hypothetical protein AJ79_03093, partial [Helicocarpus griseus UAMH5409]